MKIIKIIDLLVRCLDKDETLPKEIKFRGIEYKLEKHSNVYSYVVKNNLLHYLLDDISLVSRLNEYAEIIEEKSEIIEPLTVVNDGVEEIIKITTKLNEVIDVVNKHLKETNEKN